MVSDPIADMLAQIKNASLGGRDVVKLPFSRMKESLAKTLVEEGYLQSAEKGGSGIDTVLTMRLQKVDGKSVITDLKRISKPGLRIYVDKHSIPVVVGGMGVAILSTPLGIMTGRKAKKQGIGGEVLCEIW